MLEVDFPVPCSELLSLGAQGATPPTVAQLRPLFSAFVSMTEDDAADYAAGAKATPESFRSAGLAAVAQACLACPPHSPFDGGFGTCTASRRKRASSGGKASSKKRARGSASGKLSTLPSPVAPPTSKKRRTRKKRRVKLTLVEDGDHVMDDGSDSDYHE